MVLVVVFFAFCDLKVMKYLLYLNKLVKNMSEQHTHIVIMAGGVGSRLYPLSTPEKPKQFLDLLGSGRSLLQMTVERFGGLCPEENFWVVTSENYVHYVKEQVPAIPEGHILAEPCPRNTAPCIAYACIKVLAEDPDAVVAVTPADAYVPDAAAFRQTVAKALDHARNSKDIVCLGISPLGPATVYGYIQTASGTPCEAVADVLSFKEKPDLATATRYLAEGGYFWNAGIFVALAGTLESQIRTYAPGIASEMDRIAASFGTPSEAETLARLFPLCEKISIDYAVMEKSPDVRVIPASWEWSDLGSFESLERYKK